jgi:uncharacterized cupin superfamily protein
MKKIKIESHPDMARLEKLKVSDWPEWEKGVSTMPWTYFEDETSYVLEGRVIVTPDQGDPVEISKGNLVTFPAGLSCVWQIIEPIRKRFRIG